MLNERLVFSPIVLSLFLRATEQKAAHKYEVRFEVGHGDFEDRAGVCLERLHQCVALARCPGLKFESRYCSKSC